MIKAKQLVLTALILLLPHLAYAESPPCPLRITFIDVGEGDGALIEPPASLPLLIDSGNPISVGNIVSYAKDRSISHFAALFLTHPHLDHIGGVFELSNRYKFDAVYDNGQEITNAAKDNDMYRWYSNLVRKHSYQVLRSESQLRFGQVVIDVLWPKQGGLDADWNNNSLVLRLTFGKFRALFMGDALRETEESLVSLNVDMRADILKAGHHASANTGTMAFLDRIAPKLAVVSVNSDNIRGYPNAETLSRYTKVSRVMRTDLNGNITVCANLDGTYSVSSER